jgi:hypothetical protein
VRRGFLWASLVVSSLVVVGIFVQVYLIASAFFGAGGDAVDAHEGVGAAVVHPLEILVFLTALGAYWRRWGDVALGFLVAALGSAQIGLAEGEDWVGGLHGLFALIVLVLAAVTTHRAMRELGLGRRGAPGAGGAA